MNSSESYLLMSGEYLCWIKDTGSGQENNNIWLFDIFTAKYVQRVLYTGMTRIDLKVWPSCTTINPVFKNNTFPVVEAWYDCLHLKAHESTLYVLFL